MSRKRPRVAILVFLVPFLLPLAGLYATKKQESVMHEKRMVVLSGPSEREIHLKVGEMLQLCPFSFPVTPKYLDAKLKIELLGGRVLELIGESDISTNQEGRSGRSAFLYVRAAGKTKVRVVLVDQDNKPLEDHTTTYSVSAGQ